MKRKRTTEAQRRQRKETQRRQALYVFSVFLLSVSSVPLWFVSLSSAQPRAIPNIIVATPLGVRAGPTTRITLRGVRLDGATEVRCQHPKVRVKLLDTKKVGVGPREIVENVGDETVDVEVTVPDDAPPEAVTLSVITPAGESSPHKLMVDDAQVIAEKEPNDGFRDAQTITLPATVAGAIQAPQDVDVFKFEGKAGQRITCEVLAARLGSPLDASLTLYDAAGAVLALADDTAGTRDPVLTITLPKSGTYYLGLIDADDRGGPSHVYRLLVRPGS
jgi:Bacterial pre-peptidase C-terminal domain